MSGSGEGLHAKCMNVCMNECMYAIYGGCAFRL